MGFKASKTLLGIETPIAIEILKASWGFKASKTLLGIETLALIKSNSTLKRFKASKTLLGIETGGWVVGFVGRWASKPLKPF